jgi:hypothetical protein
MRVSIGCTLPGMLFVLLTLGTAFAQDTNFSTGPQYLLLGSSLMARPISTPSLSLAAPALEAGASNATANLVAGAENRTAAPRTHPDANLFPIYYGAAPSSVVEIHFPSAPSANQLPASILNNGVWQLTTAQALREHGHGVTLAEAAAYGKARTRHATRVYTNADVERLHGGS